MTENETEAEALCKFVRNQCFRSKASVVIDVDSGFGLKDGFIAPYAKTLTPPFQHLPEMVAFKNLFERESPHHIYRFEPQALNYTTNGDLWDHLYDEWRGQASASSVFLPLTLELGSWKWVKKNPIQLFSFLGPFNPVKPHRKRRVLRGHLGFFDFAVRALVSPIAWASLTEKDRQENTQEAVRHWYADRGLS